MAVTTSSSSKRYVLSGIGLSVFLTVIHASNDSFTAMLAALLPTLQERFSLTETTLALLVASLSFSSSVTQPLFGALSDRLGRRAVGALGVIVSSSLLSLMGIVPSVYILFALLLIGGLGSAAFHPSGTSLARSAGGENKGLAVGFFSAGGSVGLAIGPIVVLYVVANYGLGFTPYLMIPGVLLGILMFFVVPPQARAPKGNRPKLFDVKLFRGPVGLLCLSGILRSISYVTFVNAIPLYLVTVHGLARDADLIGWTLATFSVSGALGGIVTGALGRRANRQLLITGTMLMALPALYLLFVMTPGSALYFLTIALSGAFVNGGLPLMIVSAQDLAPHAAATASGMLMGFTWGTAGVLYIGIGRLQELIGIQAAMSLSFLTLIPGAVLAFYVLRKYKGMIEG